MLLARNAAAQVIVAFVFVQGLMMGGCACRRRVIQLHG